MMLQLADKSIKRSSRIVEDVLVKVDKFLLLVYFAVIDIEEDDEVPLILDRPFMKTTRMMINVDNGKMKVRVQDEEIDFNIFVVMNHSKYKRICFKIDATEEAVVDVEKQLHNPTLQEQALTNTLIVLNIKE